MAPAVSAAWDAASDEAEEEACAAAVGRPDSAAAALELLAALCITFRWMRRGSLAPEER